MGATQLTGTQVKDATISLTADVTGTLPILNGGSGQTTANAALNAYLPSQTSQSGKYLKSDGTNTSWALALTEVAEASQTAQSGAATSTATGVATLRLYGFFTMPSTEKFYLITGIEWKNGATVNGSVLSGVDSVNEIPAISAIVVNYALGQYVAATGTSTIQRNSRIISDPIRAGALVGAWIQSDSTTHTFQLATVTASNSRKTVTFPTLGNATRQDNIAWTSSAAQAYIKIYYVGYS